MGTDKPRDTADIALAIVENQDIARCTKTDKTIIVRHTQKQNNSCREIWHGLQASRQFTDRARNRTEVCAQQTAPGSETWRLKVETPAIRCSRHMRCGTLRMKMRDPSPTCVRFARATRKPSTLQLPDVLFQKRSSARSVPSAPSSHRQTWRT